MDILPLFPFAFGIWFRVAYELILFKLFKVFWFLVSAWEQSRLLLSSQVRVFITVHIRLREVFEV